MAVNHEEALRALAPLELCDQVLGGLVVEAGIPCPCPFCSIRRIDAAYFDSVQQGVEQVHRDAFSVLESGDPTRWEEFLGFPPDSTLTLQQRWDRIREARTTRNGASLAFFQALASSLGYSVRIDRGVYPFRAGISTAGDSVKAVNRLSAPIPGDSNDVRNQAAVVSNPYDPAAGFTAISATAPYPSDFWTWVVVITSLGSNPSAARLRERFEALKPSYSTISWMDS